MRLFFMFAALLVSTVTFAQEEFTIADVKNDIVLGPLAGNRDLAFGVKFILEEALQDEGRVVLSHAVRGRNEGRHTDSVRPPAHEHAATPGRTA
jgi:hypothetical protein